METQFQEEAELIGDSMVSNDLREVVNACPGQAEA